MRARFPAIAVASVAVFMGLPASPLTAHAASGLTAKWSAFESSSGNHNDFLYAGLAAGDLFGDGHEDIVAAFPDGVVKVYDSTNGNVLWAIQTDGEVSDTPTLADLYNNGQEEVIVTTHGGSVYVWAPNGQLEPGWPQHTQDGAAKHTGFPDAFQAGVAVGQIYGDGRNMITTVGWDHYMYVWDAFGNQQPHFPINLADTAWTTPALVPNASNPNMDDIIVGADSDGGLEPYSAGGEYFRFTNAGCPSTDYLINHSNDLGQKNLKGANACNEPGSWPAQISNTAWSSPTVFKNGASWDTLVGAGSFFNTGNPKDCSATLDPSDCGRSFRLLDPNGNVLWTHATSHGQVLTTAAVGNIKSGDDGHDIAITDNGLQGGGSCLYAVNSAGSDLPGFPQCGGIVQWSQPVIGPIDNAGHNGIWIGQGGFLDSYNSSDTPVTSTQFGDGTGYLPGAPVLFNNGGGVEVAAMGADTAAGGAYNQWEIAVFNVDPGNASVGSVGGNAYPRYHFDNNDEGEVQSAVAPSVPSHVTATAGNAQATVNWTPSVDIGSSAPIQWDVNVYDKTGGVVSTQNFSTPFATVTGLTNGQPYYFRVRSDNGANGDWSIPSYSVTPYPSATPAAAANNTVVAAAQYRLPYSDGTTWQDLDPNNLAFSLSPGTTTSYMLTGNVDLWTSSSGFNQDVGICVVSGTTNCNSAGTDIIAWKESGGSAGTFSPNAAAVQGIATLSGGTTYTVKLVWKANRPAAGASIWAAAGGPAYSQTRLSARSLNFVGTALSAQQQHLDASDGSSWVQMAPSGLSTTFTTDANSPFLTLTANADLWTATAGFNQDIGILVQSSADTNYGASGHVVAWKESGGFAGTFSPNAAFVSTTIPVTANTQYTATLVWKSNKPMTLSAGHGIYFGAGNNPNFSPATLFAMQPKVPLSGRVFSYPNYPATSSQYHMTGNQNQWTPLDTGNANYTAVTLNPPAPSCLTVISVNVDLWTGNAGFNQDIGIGINGTLSSNIAAWKESGGFAGTFSPNAAYVEYEYVPTAGDTVSVAWKTNQAGGATIFAAAGNSPNFSPTTLTIQYLC